MSIDEGEVVGYIGPNGAGKSTTIKMLTGILVPTSGTIDVAGIVPYERRRQNARNIGVVFGQRSQLYWDLPLRESFELLRAIYRVPRARFQANLKRFVEILELGPFMATPVRQLSLGERMRGDFAAALLHEPRIVYLDEPTIGLDIVAKEAIRVFIADINQRLGTTVILTTHDLADVERLCRRLVLIDHGTIIYDGSVERLRNEYGTHRTLIVHLTEPQPGFFIEGVEIDRPEALTARLRFDRRTITAEALIRRVTERYSITDVAINEPEIDDIVRHIYLEGYHAPPVLDAEDA
jgi:ABC-2 type transport system ATP-binding protein